MACILDGGKLTLSGYVGDDLWGDGFTYADVVLALAEIEDDADLTVHLNSPGGIATEGAAVHALLISRAGNTNVVVEGIAASAASLIAMAGETVTMADGSIMMIHDPAGMTWGTSEDHAKSIEGLEALATAYARVYAAKSGRTASECREIMKAERWYTPEQAVEDGFADRTSEAKSIAVAAFDYQAFAHAPERLVALARKKNWSFEAKKPEASAPVNPSQKGNDMTDKERADQLAAEDTKLKADLDAAAASDQEELATLRAEKVARANADAVMALDEAKGREPQAKALADAGVKADAAKAILAAAPTADTGTPGTAEYEAARAAGAGLKGGGQPPAQKSTQAQATAAAIANMKKLLGNKETA